jgi:hypothetical protein
MRARLNAIASAKMALGQLQQLAGPDQRVTMRADMYDAGNPPGAQSSSTVSDNPSAPKSLSHQKRYWTGVWATGGVSANRVRDWNVAKPHDTRLFLGWLTSPGVIISSADPEIADVSKLPNYIPNSSAYIYPSNASPYPPATGISDPTGKNLIDDLVNPLSNTPDTVLVPLLSRGSVKMTTNTPSRWAVEYSGAVDAMPVPLPGPNSGSSVKYGINGRYAFWVGDEGVKAKANIPDVYGITSGGSNYKTALSIWDEGFRGSGAQRSALEAILPADKLDYTGATILTNAWKFSTWRDADIVLSNSWDTSYMARVRNPNDLSVWANTVSGTAAGDAMRDAAKILWHDVTPWSYSTITDTYNGGVKVDLSTAFELPYAVYRGLETYYGQKNTTTTAAAYNRAPSLFHDASNRSAAPSAPYAYDIDYNRYGFYNVSIFKIGSLEHIGTPDQVLASYPRAAEWAPAYLSSMLGTAYTQLGTQNGNEPPERMGFVYEVPLRNDFWNGIAPRKNPFTNDTNKTSTDNLNGRIERGPTWDLYRNYYRMYKLETEACTTKQKILGQPAVGSGAVFARGVDPISFANGYTKPNSGANPTRAPYGFLESEASSTSNSSYNSMYRYSNYTSVQGPQYNFHMGNTSGRATGNTVPPVTWPTSMKITPSVIRFAMIYSLVWNDDKLGICIDPFIVVHNPYDCAIEFPGIAMVSSEKEASHIFEFYYQKTPKDTLVAIGDIFTGQSFEANHQVAFRAVAGSRGTTFGGGDGATKSNVFRLEPGEVRLIGATNDPNSKPIDAYTSIDIPCDFVYTEGSQFYIPINPYANVSYRANSVTGTDTLPKAAPKSETDTDYTNVYGKSNTKLLYAAQQLFLGGWNGTISDFNAKGSTGQITVKARNEGSLSFQPYTGLMTKPDNTTTGAKFYMAFQDLNNLGKFNKYTRGGGHVVDGGNQDYCFYLQYDTNAAGQQLNKFRHWMGPVQFADENSADTFSDTTANKYSITNIFCVNEPLIMELRGLTSGWPLYGNANKGYSSASDPEFGSGIVGFDMSYGDPPVDPLGNKHPIARTLPEAFNGSGGWRAIGKSTGVDLLNSKVGKQFFILDFFVRGAKETSSAGAATYYKTYPSDAQSQWPNPLKVPDEILPAPISPYFISTRPQQASYMAYDGKASAPLGWICRQSPLNGGGEDKAIDTPTSGIGKTRNQSYWGKSIRSNENPDGTNVILFPIPRRPLLSLSQLGAAGTAQFVTDPDLTVGSSFANPGIKDLSKIVDWPGTKANETVIDPAVPEHGYALKASSGGNNIGEMERNKANVRTDTAFAANLNLWDSYWFSGLNTQAKSYSDNPSTAWPTGPNLPTDSAILGAQATALGLNGVTDLTTLNGIKSALDKGFNPLANKRVAYRPDSSVPSMAAASTVGMQNTIFPDYLTFPHPTFLGRRSLYDGGFNVNSTSKAAWKAILASLRKQKLPEGSAQADGTPLTRFARAFGSNDGTKTPWSSYRELTDSEIDDLAAAVVNEVRKRGPFMSLSDFINRRLVNSDSFGLKGALQAAIDATNINGEPFGFNGVITITNGGGVFEAPKGVALSSPYLPIKANDRFPSIRSMSKTKKDSEVTAALGAPGIVTQMDVLNSIGPNLTARSDTFVIRAYGEAFDNNGQSIGKAWVEVVAQRSTDYIALANEEPNIRAQFYRNNDGSSNSDYETKPTTDRYKRNTSSNVTKNQLINLNRILGRRFNTISLRWLNPQEI